MPSVPASRRLVTARIWFWQVRAARVAGWFVRSPAGTAWLRWFDPFLSPRLTVARFFELPVAVVKPVKRIHGYLPEIVTDFGGAANERDRPDFVSRLLHHLLVAVRPVVEDISHRDLCQYGERVHLRYDAGNLVPRGLSINEIAQLLGQPHPLESHLPFSTVGRVDMSLARRAGQAESGGAA